MPVARERTESTGSREPAEPEPATALLGIDSVPVPMVVVGNDGQLRYANRAWREFTGVDAFEGTPAQVVMHEEDQPMVDALWERAQSLGTGYGVECRLRRHDGTFRWHDWQVSPLPPSATDPEGGWIAVGIDIEDRRALETAIEHARDHAALLAEAGAEMAAARSVKEAMDAAVRAAAPGFCDIAVVDLLRPEGTERVALAIADLGIPDARERIRRYAPSLGEPNDPGFAMVASGRPIFIPELDPSQFEGRLADPDQELLLRQVRPGSAIIAPLSMDGGTFGAISFIRTADRPRFREDEFATGVELARRAALHIDRARALAEMAEASGAKDELFAMVSHEVRTPVTMLSGASSLLRRRYDTLPAEERDALLLDIETHAQRLLRITENLLAMGGKGRRLADTLEPVLLQRALPAAAERFEFGHPGARVGVRLPPGLPPVLASEATLEQVIGNLLDNAFKYCGGEPVEITAQHDEGRGAVRVDVADRGPGLSPELLGSVFQPFVRGRGEALPAGLGLGLAVCERLVNASGGSIWAAPREGGGTVFSFEFPVVEGGTSEGAPARD